MRLRDEGGSALITALFASMLMLVLGVALLAIVDTQSSQATEERTLDRGFNLAEGVLTTEAFVLGRNWPLSPPGGNPACSSQGAGFTDTVGSTAPTVPAVERLRENLNHSYSDPAYRNATWQVNICDDVDGQTVWSDAVLQRPAWDANGNNLVWVRAQARVQGKPRAVVGLVTVRQTEVLDPRYGLVAGRVTDDLGSTVNNLSNNLLGGVLTGLLGATPTVAADPTETATNPPSSGVTGVRCGVLDLSVIPPVTCLSGTLGAAGALPLVSNLITGGKVDKFPRTTAASATVVDRLRSVANLTDTYYRSSPGAASANAAPACQFTGANGVRNKSTVVFLEQIGDGDDYCVLDVGAGVQFKALVIGKGRVVLRGNGTATGTPTTSNVPQVNTFSGVVYALNQQRLPVDDGGMGLGDAATPGREVVLIEKGAHVKGAVYVDGKSGRVSIVPPPLNVNNTSLCRALLGNLVCGLLGILSLDDLVDELTRRLGVTAVVNGLLNQLSSQRAAYGSAIVSDTAAVEALKVYGASGVTPGSFKDLQAR